LRGDGSRRRQWLIPGRGYRVIVRVHYCLPKAVSRSEIS
jgi:hypothetical protein